MTEVIVPGVSFDSQQETTISRSLTGHPVGVAGSENWDGESGWMKDERPTGDAGRQPASMARPDVSSQHSQRNQVVQSVSEHQRPQIDFRYKPQDAAEIQSDQKRTSRVNR